ncbi:MAG: 7-cyano-7-deazaguanine synthase QueC [Betaproteobacteria bacterium]|nr:7-cyano-7-deazaguanine synthase QueC [Betaproteobacteria bacterium]MBU6513933.1 7-cyano-7-deazaguanine synthase QueC [Betaproteobacteria bacterium]MDE1956031.1 7-cyano-7-deazaguanine synthase QueC [Betaproteobacteria bacterium]
MARAVVPAAPGRGAPAVVLVSGGLDSATVLALAREAGYACHALSLDYGQRHRAELDAARRVAQALGAVRHEIVQVDFGRFGGSSLTDTALQVPTGANSAGIPSTYVPARNTVMLSLALSWAEALGGHDLFYGANAVDYSGYPDCRPAYVEAFERLANLATRAGVEGQAMRVHAPIIELSKAEIIAEGLRLGVDFSLTVSCYQADDQGRACGRCDSCRIRAAGFAAAGVDDPTRYHPR